jgi:hypothetical protein
LPNKQLYFPNLQTHTLKTDSRKANKLLIWQKSSLTPFHTWRASRCKFLFGNGLCKREFISLMSPKSRRLCTNECSDLIDTEKNHFQA